jgi:hypothetical protein
LQTLELKRIYAVLEGTKPNFADDGHPRHLVREGTLTYYEEDSNEHKKRHYYLISDMLLVAELRKVPRKLRCHQRHKLTQPSLQTPTSKHRLRLTVLFDTARLEAKPDGTSYLGQECLHSFIMHCPTRSHLFWAETAEDKNVLLEHITSYKVSRR